MTPIRINFKRLKESKNKSNQKYLILISDHTVIIDSEWEAMKKATRHCRLNNKQILDMLPTYARTIAQTTGLTKLLENLELTK